MDEQKESYKIGNTVFYGFDILLKDVSLGFG